MHTILVYDDEEPILEVIKIVLEEAGFKVITSVHGETALSDIERYKPSIVLLDIWMKEIHGHEIVKKIKAKSLYKNMPVILISALNETESIANKVNADGFLKKPFDINELVCKVQYHILKSQYIPPTI